MSKLSNMTPEQKIEHKKHQRCEIQKRYYQRNKDYYKNYAKNNSYTAVLKKRIEAFEEKNRLLLDELNNKNEWCQLIIDIGFDYDGYNDADNLKLLIDELVLYASCCRDNRSYKEFMQSGDTE